jgi:outer membrane biosynthesis protein TonB
MRKSLALSLFGHVFLILFVIFYKLLFHRPIKLQDDGSFVVNFVKVERVSKAPVIGPAPQIKNEKAPKPIMENKTPEPEKKIKKEKKEEAAVLEDKKGLHEKAKKQTKEKQTPTKTKKKVQPKAPQQEGGDGQQRAAEIGDTVTASEIMFIKQLVKKLWQIPATAISMGVDVRVLLTIDDKGSVTGAQIIKPVIVEDPEHYALLEDSIQAVIEHKDFNFAELSPEMLKMLGSGKPLDLIFNPKDVA